VGVISDSRSVGSTVTFTSGLDPNDGIDETGASVGSGTSSEASVDDVAPVTPLVTKTLLTRAALVDDEVCGESF